MAAEKGTKDDAIKAITQDTSSNRLLGNFKNTPGVKDIKVGKIREYRKDTDAVIRDLSKLYGGKRRSSKKARKSRRRSKNRRRRSKKSLIKKHLPR